MKKTVLYLLFGTLLFSNAFALTQDAGDKMKAGVKKIGKGAKDMGEATAEGTKSAAKAVKRKTVKGAKATKRATKKGVKKVGEGTEKTGKAIKKAGSGN